jgi:outer membrane lipoprotein carrier protein
MRVFFCLLCLTSLLRADVDTRPLENWLKRQKSLESLDTAFVQERTLPSLKKPVTTAGRMRLLRPGKLLWELGDPVKTMAVSDGKTLYLLDALKKRGRSISTSANEAKQFTMMTDDAFRDLESFQATFEIVESRVESGIYQLTLKPKDKTMQSHVPWMFLDIDPDKSELKAIEIQLEDRSRVKTIFSNPKVNPKLDEGIFHPDLSGYLLI